MPDKLKTKQRTPLSWRLVQVSAIIGCTASAATTFAMVRNGNISQRLAVATSISGLTTIALLLARAVLERRGMLQVDPAAARRRHRYRLFQGVDLLSFFLPRRARLETFLPSYYEVQGDFVQAWRRHRSKAAQRLLTVLFILHVVGLLGQTLWALCSDKAKRMILRLLPDMIRRIWGI